MKYLKDIEMDTLEINELQDYADMKEIDLDKEINDILNTGVRNLYKKLVPRDRQALIERKLEKTKKVTKPKDEKKTTPKEDKKEEKILDDFKKDLAIESTPKVEQKEVKPNFGTGLFK